MSISSEIFERNIAALRVRQATLAEQLHHLGPQAPFEDFPADIGKKFFHTQPLKHPSMVSFFGVGHGCHLSWFFAHPPEKLQAVVIFEHSLVQFARALTCRDWSQWLGRQNVWCFVGLTVEDIRTQIWAATGNFMFLVSATAGRDNCVWPHVSPEIAEYYIAVAGALSELVPARFDSSVGSIDDHYYGLLNALPNIPWLCRTPVFHGLAGSVTNVPGVVVATGPSLNASLPALKALAPRAIVFACDSAVPMLLEHGITPHFIACLERVHGTTRLIDRLPPLPHTALVSLPVVFPETIAAYRGPQMSFISQNFRLEWLLPDISLRWVGGSAATLAFAGLLELGCRDIFLFGQDLAYDRASHRSHALGASEWQQAHGAKHRTNAEANRENFVEGNDGTPILTCIPYRMMAQAVAQLAHGENVRCRNVIPKHYGVKILHTTLCEPQTLVDHVRDISWNSAPTFDDLCASRPLAPVIAPEAAEQAIARFQQQLADYIRLCEVALQAYLFSQQSLSLMWAQQTLLLMTTQPAFNCYISSFVQVRLLMHFHRWCCAQNEAEFVPSLIDIIEHSLSWAVRVQHIFEQY